MTDQIHGMKNEYPGNLSKKGHRYLYISHFNRNPQAARLNSLRFPKPQSPFHYLNTKRKIL